MEAAILDEDLAGAGTRYNHARQVNTWNVRFESLRVAHWPSLPSADFDAERPKKVEIRMISRQSEYKIIRDLDLAGGRLQ